MARFDFIEMGVQAYIFVWEERRAVALLAVPCILVKLLCMGAVLSLGLSDNFLRAGLVVLPAYFAEGWMLAHLIRLALYREYWPYRFDGDSEQEGERGKASLRHRYIMAGIIVYVLIDLVLTSGSSFVLGEDIQTQVQEMEKSSEAPSAFNFLLGGIAFASVIWAFRLAWLYIPAVMGYPMGRFLSDIKEYTTSFYMFGTFFMCLLPTMLVLQVLFSLVLYLLPGGLEDPGLIVRFITMFIQIIIQTSVAIVTTIGMSFAIRAMLFPAKP